MDNEQRAKEIAYKAKEIATRQILLYAKGKSTFSSWDVEQFGINCAREALNTAIPEYEQRIKELEEKLEAFPKGYTNFVHDGDKLIEVGRSVVAPEEPTDEIRKAIANAYSELPIDSTYRQLADRTYKAIISVIKGDKE